MRTFKENLNLANKFEIVILDMRVACAVRDNVNFDLTEDEFEKVCQKVETAYMKSDDIEVEDIAYYVGNEIDNGSTYMRGCVVDILNMNIKELISNAKKFLNND